MNSSCGGAHVLPFHFEVLMSVSQHWRQIKTASFFWRHKIVWFTIFCFAFKRNITFVVYHIETLASQSEFVSYHTPIYTYVAFFCNPKNSKKEKKKLHQYWNAKWWSTLSLSRTHIYICWDKCIFWKQHQAILVVTLPHTGKEPESVEVGDTRQRQAIQKNCLFKEILN